MAMPSAVTLGSLAFVAAAGAGLVVVVTTAGDDTQPAAAETTTPDHQQAPAPSAKKHADRRDHDRSAHQKSDVVPKTLVDVFNNSGVSGLASDRAGFLAGAGWNVAGTDNWYGEIPANTVYYPPGMKSDARKLAKTLEYHRLRPAVAPMQFDRLTVIITSDS